MQGWRRGILQAATLAVLGGAVGGSGCIAIPPYGEALVIVDTDARDVRWVNRMRMDLYSADGSVWYESRDVSLRDERDWPASFSLYDEDTVHEKVALLRIRLYVGGRERDYHGERLTIRDGRGAPGDSAIPRVQCDDPDACELPRLASGPTPRAEPEPSLANDRLLLVRLTPGVRGSVHVVLRGACIGTMADIANQRTCVGTDGTYEDVTEAVLDPDLTIPPLVPVTFGAAAPCPADANPRPPTQGKALFDGEKCIDGGTFVFGNSPLASPAPDSGTPQRIARLPAFYMDTYEVTVGRWRAALSRGFKPPSAPIANGSTLVRDTCNPPAPADTRWCTYTATPGVPEDRERYPLSCVSWDAARAFCQFEGGDLPTEAQWEYVAQAAGRVDKSDFPWGNELPTCKPAEAIDRAVYHRIWECAGTWHSVGFCIAPRGNPDRKTSCNAGNNFRELCGNTVPSINPRQGPQPEDAVDYEGGDRSYGAGIVDLFGSMNEYTLDSFYSLESQCWAVAPQISPRCFDPSSSLHTLRGGSWITAVGAGQRLKPETNARSASPPQIGFRCVRPLEER
jgi:formylglycine-generating enzyme required for sulfatase activity